MDKSPSGSRANVWIAQKFIWLAVLLLTGQQLVAVEDPGKFLALTIQKFEKGIDPPRPILVWALGNTALDSLDDGTSIRKALANRFPHCPPIELKKKTGVAATWEQVNSWITDHALSDHPDLLILYATGKPKSLDKLLTKIRSGSTADILVPSIHWRMADKLNWGKTENAVDQDVAVLRETCRKHGAELVENRKRWAEHLQLGKLPIESLLRDKTVPNSKGASLLHNNIIAQLRRPARGYHYEPRTRERRVNISFSFDPGEAFSLPFTGNRVELIGLLSPDGGNAQVFIDGKPGKTLSFTGRKGEKFRFTLADNLANKQHILRIVPSEGTTLGLNGLDIFEPPLQLSVPTAKP